MTGSGRIRASMLGAEQRLAQLKEAVESGEVDSTVELDKATEDLSASLEELNVALEELETTNEELVESQFAAESEGRRYRELFELTPAACLVTDAKGVILEANRATEQFLGQTGRLLIGKPLSAFVESPDHARFFRFLDGGRPLGETPRDEFELRMKAADGLRFKAGLTAVAAVGESGDPGIRWLIRDMTIQLQQERDRRDAGDREAYSQMARGVINHFNNLLGSIRGFAEIVLREGETSARGAHAAKRIRTATERGERLTKHLLSFAHSPRPTRDVQPVNITVGEACRVATEALPDHRTVAVDLSLDVNQVRVEASGLYRALSNIILNASDALPEGGTISISTRPVDLDRSAAEALELRPGRYVAISVTDEGMGMDAETRARAPEPFFSTKAIDSGFGLGLATAETVAREAKGGLDVQSEPGVGTTVTLLFPYED